ncbi:MAG: fatty acid desaturase [Phycisphaerales bacterium]|nr:fatty acid desaturase [Phycisphaerales bacterium]
MSYSIKSEAADDLEHENESAWSRRIVADLYTPRPVIYWADLLLTTSIGWGAFVLTVIARPGSLAMWGWGALAVIALYRASIFAHELSHLRTAALPGFTAVWDLLVGIPLLVPAFVYVGMHKDHHTISTYGTNRDPEYFPFAGAKARIACFAVTSFLLPVMVSLRFIILSPVGLCWPRFHRGLERHASSLTINHAYVREMSAREHVRTVLTEIAILVAWALVFVLAARGVLPLRVFGVWYAVLATTGFVNTLRTLGAHRYESDGHPMTRLEQLADSIDTPGAFWTELWAPVGLRYHALHHYFPGLPYHSLGTAYARLTAALGPETVYRRVSSSSLGASLVTLWGRAPHAASNVREEHAKENDAVRVNRVA